MYRMQNDLRSGMAESFRVPSPAAGKWTERKVWGNRSNLTSVPNREPLPQRHPPRPPPQQVPLCFSGILLSYKDAEVDRGRTILKPPPPPLPLPLPAQRPLGIALRPTRIARGKASPSGTQLTFGGARAHGGARGVPEPPGASRREPSFVRCPGPSNCVWAGERRSGPSDRATSPSQNRSPPRKKRTVQNGRGERWVSSP